MRHLPALFFAASLTSVTIAQVTLPPHASTYNGYSRGFNFTAGVAFNITQLELPPNAFLPGDTAGFLVRINGATALRSVGNATAAIPVNIAVAVGDVVDVIGNWSPAVTGNFTAHNSYANTAPYSTLIEGVPHTLQRTGWQWDIADAAWATGTYVPPATGQFGRILMYTSSGSGTVQATNATLGSGCGTTSFNSFYQDFPNATAASAALTGNALLLSPTSTGYVGTWAAGAAASLYVTPVAPLPVTTGDDGEVTLSPSIPLSTPYGPQTSLRITGNGIIGFGSLAMDFPATTAYVPLPGGFLNSTQGGIYCWHDFNSGEAGSGPIQSEEIGGTLYITFNDVESYAVPETANRSTMQFQLDLANGNVRIVWVAVDGNSTSTFGSGWLVGVTAPGISNDPGSSNLATGLAISSNPELQPLALTANTRPILGTSWALSTNSIPPTGTLGVEILGLTDPNVPDLAFLGMPGCGLRASLDLLSVWLVTGDTHAWSVALPNNPALLSFSVHASSAVFENPPINAFGAITSNGVRGVIGDF